VVFLQLVGSAPQFPHGVIDPITEIAQVIVKVVYIFCNDKCVTFSVSESEQVSNSVRNKLVELKC